jgi:hypothetical protein
VVVLLPGAAYTPQGPLLWFTREVALGRGWDALEVWDRFESGDPRSWANDRLGAALVVVGERPVAVASKSLSSFAAGQAADRGIPGVWLTPLLREQEVADAFARMQPPALLVGGSADPLWDSDAAGRLEHLRVAELEGLDHRLERDGDVPGSLAGLAEVTDLVDAFLAGLG